MEGNAGATAASSVSIVHCLFSAMALIPAPDMKKKSSSYCGSSGLQLATWVPQIRFDAA